MLVLVTGVFDILHQEHLKLLQQAKALGGILYVGLEPDHRVRQLKGQGRPINNALTRIKQLKQLKLADKVFILPDLSTPASREQFLRRLKPDIIAVSASTPFLTEKKRLMKLINGQVKIVLPHNPSISTSKMLKSNQ